MLNQRHQAAMAVASELLPAERELDSAIVRNARVTIAVVEGRRKCRLPLTTAQDGLDLVTRANARLIEARALLAQAHLAFRQTQDEIGLRALSYGDEQECPPSAGQLVPAAAANAA